MSAKARVIWFGGKQYVGIDSSKHSMIMSSQDEENGTGMRPTDVLMASLGGCTAMGVTDILQKKRLDLRGLEINVSGEQSEEPPRPFTTIHVEYVITGSGISEKAVQDAIDLSLGSYCSVSSTLKGKAEITTSIKIIEG